MYSGKMLEALIARLLDEPIERIDDGAGRQTLRNWNSLRHVELIIGLEDHFGVKFTRREVHDLSTVGAIRSALRGKGVAV
jgi:acyl carrier protein